MSAGRAERVRRCGQGDLIACSTLQEGLEVFETSFGFWAHRRVLGMDVTLGGPICAPDDRPDMIRRFLSRARRPILFYVREDVLRDLDGAGLHGAGIGIDRHVDIPRLLAAPERQVRGAVKKARRARVHLEPLDLAALDPATRRRMDEITGRYLAGAEVEREMSFVNRPMSFVPDGMRRVFALHKHDREHDGMFGYAVLNPIYEAGEVTSYLLDILRFEPTRLWGVWLSTVHALAERLAAEGFGLSLGFCPLHRVRPAPHGGSRLLQAQLDWMVRYLSSTQYLRRLRELKDLIPGPEEPRYLASFSRLAIVSVYAIVEAMGVGFGSLLGPGLLDVLADGIRNRLALRTAPPEISPEISSGASGAARQPS
jgi:lysylphosphatidylglycerol synthetase-like protein (DUF2156 family)